MQRNKPLHGSRTLKWKLLSPPTHEFGWPEFLSKFSGDCSKFRYACKTVYLRHPSLFSAFLLTKMRTTIEYTKNWELGKKKWKKWELETKICFENLQWNPFVCHPIKITQRNSISVITITSVTSCLLWNKIHQTKCRFHKIP